jgi:hypothetical protein
MWDLVFIQYSQIPLNTLPQKYSTMMESFLFSKKYTTVEGICGISRDYPLKIRTSKQSIGEIPGFEIIPSHPLKYLRSKQDPKKMDNCCLASRVTV